MHGNFHSFPQWMVRVGLPLSPVHGIYPKTIIFFLEAFFRVSWLWCRVYKGLSSLFNSFDPFSWPYERIECFPFFFLSICTGAFVSTCLLCMLLLAGMFHRFTRVVPRFLSWLGPGVWFLCLFCVVLVGLCCFLVWFCCFFGLTRNVLPYGL